MNRLLFFMLLLFMASCMSKSLTEQNEHGVGDLTLEQQQRYTKIEGYIQDNLHIGAHFVYAVGVNTTIAVWPKITEQDIPVLLHMLGDYRVTVSGGASRLLVKFGDRVIPKLNKIEKSSTRYAGSAAYQAILTLETCRNPPQALRREVCPE